MRNIKIVLFLYLIIEIASIFYVANQMGFFAMFSEVIISAFIGGLVLLNTKEDFLDTLMGFKQIKVSSRDFFRGNSARVLGGILLILPGIFCDIFGLIVLINAYFILRRKQEEYQEAHQDEDVIDVEVIKEDKK